MASPLENTFALQLRQANIPFLREVKGIVSGRRFRYDFQVKDLLIEIQGGIFRKGARGRGGGSRIRGPLLPAGPSCPPACGWLPVL